MNNDTLGLVIIFTLTVGICLIVGLLAGKHRAYNDCIKKNENMIHKEAVNECKYLL